MMVDIVAAARLVVDLDRSTRQHPGDPVRPGSTRDKKARARLNGALLVWEALTGKDVEYARGIVLVADRWRTQNAGLIETWSPGSRPRERGAWRHEDGTPCPNYPDSFDFTYVEEPWSCAHGALVCHRAVGASDA